MYLIDCPTCHTRRIGFARDLVSIAETAAGFRVQLQCPCGEIVDWYPPRAATERVH